MGDVGKVYLVGAGPGDPELISLKGVRVLREADVIVYDRLANPVLLRHARPDAETIYAGKLAHHHTLEQRSITALLIDRARDGKVVCRLKGGDPFLFGRGGEEAAALVAAGIPWEYVPGITSAIAVPGYAGIPVTHRDHGVSVTIVTAHEKAETSSVDWERLAGSRETIVLLMGMERLADIAARLIELGRPPDTPVAVTSWGCRPEQRTVTAPLAEIATRCAAEAMGPPSVIVIGTIVNLRQQLRWWETHPLFGKRIVVTRATEQAGVFSELLTAVGAEVIHCPTIRFEALEPDLSLLDRDYDWVLFTSANGVEHFVRALRGRGRDIRAIGRARVAAIGPGTARAVEAAGLRVDFIPSTFVAEAVLSEFPESVAGKRILIPRAETARDLLPAAWRAQGASVDLLPVYRTRPDNESLVELRRRLEERSVDAITFTASSTVTSLLLGLPVASLVDSGARVACIGPITAQTAGAAGLPVHAVAEEHTIPGLLLALTKLFGEQ